MSMCMRVCGNKSCSKRRWCPFPRRVPFCVVFCKSAILCFGKIQQQLQRLNPYEYCEKKWRKNKEKIPIPPSPKRIWLIRSIHLPWKRKAFPQNPKRGFPKRRKEGKASKRSLHLRGKGFGGRSLRHLRRVAEELQELQEAIRSSNLLASTTWLFGFRGLGF